MSRFVPIPRTILTDPRFEIVWDNDLFLATWLRLSIEAGLAWPQPAILTMDTSAEAVEALVSVGLVIREAHCRYRMPDMDVWCARGKPIRPVRKASERPKIPTRMRFLVLERDGFRCCYCGRQAPSVALEADHVIPVLEGGPTSLENLVTSCWECNSGKGKHRLRSDPWPISK